MSQYFNQAASFLNLDKNIKSLIEYPNKVIEVSLAIKLDNGQVFTTKGFRSQFNNNLGPYKGGIRFSPSVTKEEVVRLSALMTWKTALFNLPLGGAKGGVMVDTKKISLIEKEKLARSYIRSLAPNLGPNLDIPAPDMYTDEQVMIWMMDEYEKLYSRHYPNMITGKPIILGGSLVRDKATALGAFNILTGLSNNLSTVALFGFGNAGGHLAQILDDNGYKVVAVADSTGAVYNSAGLLINKLLEHKDKTGSVIDFSNASNIDKDELLTLPVDVLVPAAGERTITLDKAKNIQTKVILEVANDAIEYEAEEILKQKNIDIIPDILTNAGGVIVSYLEQIQNASGYYWDEKTVEKQLKNKMLSTLNLVKDSVNKNKIDWRLASYALAIARVAEATKLRGGVI